RAAQHAGSGDGRRSSVVTCCSRTAAVMRESPYISADSHPQVWCFFLGRDRIEHVSSSQLTGTAMLDRLRALESLKQAIEVEQLDLIAQVEAEGLSYDLGAKSTAVLLRDALRI